MKYPIDNEQNHFKRSLINEQNHFKRSLINEQKAMEQRQYKFLQDFKNSLKQSNKEAEERVQKITEVMAKSIANQFKVFILTTIVAFVSSMMAFVATQ